MFLIRHRFIEPPPGRRKRYCQVLFFLKERRTANRLSAVLFSFDRFSEYPLSNYRGYSENRSKTDSRFYIFPQINGKKPELLTKNSYFGGKCRNGRAPPRKFESSISQIQIFGGNLMNCQPSNKIYLENFSKPDNRCPGRGLLSFSENEEGRISV